MKKADNLLKTEQKKKIQIQDGGKFNSQTDVAPGQASSQSQIGGSHNNQTNIALTFIINEYGDKLSDKDKTEVQEAIKAELSPEKPSTKEEGALNTPETEQLPAPNNSEKASDNTSDTSKAVAEYIISAVSLFKEDVQNQEKANSSVEESSDSKDKKNANNTHRKDKLDAYGNLDNADKLYQSMSDISKGLKKWAENLTVWLGNKVKIGAFILNSSDWDKVVDVGKRLDKIVREYKAKYDAAKSVRDRSEIFEDYINTLNNLYLELEWKKQTPCEYFFEYKLIPADKDIKAKDEADVVNNEPLLFFERIDKATENNVGEYALYLTLPDWNGKSPANQFTDLTIYCKSEKGDIVSFDKSKGEEQIRECTENLLADGDIAFNITARKSTKDFQSYRAGNRRVEVYRCNSKNVDNNFYGKIILSGNRVQKAYYFFVNLTFRKRIVYQFDSHKVKTDNGSGKTVFVNKLDSVKILDGHLNKKIHTVIKQRMNVGEDRIIGDVILDPKDKTPTINYRDEYKEEEFTNINALYLTFYNPEYEKYYLLEQLAYDHAEKVSREAEKISELRNVTEEDLVCPYCHEKINFSGSSATSYYYSGGVSCQGKQPLKILQGNSVKTNCMYCDSDIAYIADYNRILPDNFLNSDAFRIAVIGAPRSGKSFFLARLFQVKDTVIALDNTPLHKYWYNSSLNAENSNNTGNANREEYSKSANKPIEAVGMTKIKGKEKEYTAANDEWGAGLYQDLVWDVNAKGTAPQCPLPTTTTLSSDGRTEELEKRPMVLKFNKPVTFFEKARSQYVYIYDTPGERVYSKQKNSKEFKAFPLLDNPGRLGCIFMYDADLSRSNSEQDFQTKQHDALDALIQRLQNYKDEHKNPDTGESSYKPIPIAIVLTKFDEYEPKFDSNAHCLRGDIYDMADFKIGRYKRLRYIGSALQNNVDMASEEISHFIDIINRSEKDNIFKLLVENKDLFSEIKFFGISSLGIKKSLANDNANGIEINRLNFLAEPKRIELPFIWLLNQFGIVD